jgi:hypothetical protein
VRWTSRRKFVLGMARNTLKRELPTSLLSTSYLSYLLLAVTVIDTPLLQNALDTAPNTMLNVASIQKTPSSGRKEAQQWLSRGTLRAVFLKAQIS